MQYVNLGATGLRVSKICLGCMTYGSSKWRPWILEEEAAMPLLRRSIELGINFFDTANVYSNGVSERQYRNPREKRPWWRSRYCPGRHIP